MNALVLTPADYRCVGLRHWLLAERGAYDRVGAAMADQHYSRRKPNSRQFLPPGERFVLISRDFSAVWGWWRPHPASGIKSMNGLDGWTCAIFRRAGGALASELVLDAELAIAACGRTCGPDGLLTYVWDGKIRSSNPGWCYQCAGWAKVGRSADGRKTLLHKPLHLAGIAACGTELPPGIAAKRAAESAAQSAEAPMML